ncbi:glycoside hydrolase family 97 protein [Sphingomonas sp. BAUL-RG-20F-R05-02]|uniref:glycoside hydrolase family 97 protein n=1 Tax=Sphingomonas sp. BAUL-RG-20F-R05-02 TaxID=2914830 RepID=UPI001F587B44|nr:glycoside hydrolase family 97 protein [Sphingomonas sp. BAUL-RG-20F-R05-02]
MKKVLGGLASVAALASCTPLTQRETTADYVISRSRHVTIKSDVTRSGGLMIAIRHGSSLLIAPSPVSLELARQPFGALTLLSRLRISAGASDCAQGILTARERSGLQREIRLETRACDDGAAFRLVIPPQRTIPLIKLASEQTRFVVPRNDQCLGVRHKKYFNSHEGDEVVVHARDIAPGELYDLPLTCVTGRGGETYALTESNIENYSAAYLTGIRDRSAIAVLLTPRPDNDAVSVKIAMPRHGFATPWRVVMIADRPEQMIANRLVDRLAAPSRIGDTGWVKPGKAAWGWWSGLLAPDVPNAGHNMPTYRRYINFAARMHLPYYLIDEGWAAKSDPNTPADVTASAAGIDIPELVRYAAQRHVRLILWADWNSVKDRVEPVLTQWQRWGIAGMKADFIYRQDQDVVAFYHRLLASAARHHLLVDLHAAFVPRGLDRTYPNYITQEGVMGNEYNRWSRDVTAGYNVRTAYSRATIGPMDYTPGGFRNVTPAEFRYRAPAPEVMTTRAHQLALFVVFPSPLMVLADAPVAYHTSNGNWAPGVDFLQEVPTVWDETRGIAGAFGEWIAVARRHGKNWYVGMITNEHGRTVSLPLTFLGTGKWRVQAWVDGKAPVAIDRRTGILSANGNLIVPLAPSGGAVLTLVRDR